ncbi:hypothetical protein BC332_15344 [Capsicum chinense]|nr:hypothetical protein BC332_15344 [Capsicum chinense]
MTVEDLIVRLRIEKDNKAAERRSKGNSTINGAHIVEDEQKNSKKRKKVEQESHQSKNKFKGKCFNYGKIGHKSTDYRAPKKGKKNDQANMIESNKECDDLCAMFSECNLVGNPRKRWMDSGATRHVYANKELFSLFALAQVEEMIYMANSATLRNLISVSLLDKNKFKCVNVSGKIVISKGEVGEIEFEYGKKGHRQLFTKPHPPRRLATLEICDKISEAEMIQLPTSDVTEKVLAFEHHSCINWKKQLCFLNMHLICFLSTTCIQMFMKSLTPNKTLENITYTKPGFSTNTVMPSIIDVIEVSDDVSADIKHYCFGSRNVTISTFSLKILLMISLQLAAS